MDLLDAVYEDPSDEAARRVYADWLISQGDPRGELIALQLSRASIAAERRAVELLWKYGRAWLSPFERSIGEFRFERGFLAECELKKVTKAMVGHPSWSTVSKIRLRAADSALVGAFLLSRVMRSLREVSGVGPKALAMMLKPGAESGIERLEVQGVKHVAKEAVLGLPRLKTLRYG